MRIIGPPTAYQETVRANLPSQANALFLQDMLPELWEAAVDYGVDPVGVVAQSGKETAWGTFPGQVKPGFYNTAGLKIRDVGMTPESTGDKPHAHTVFPNWRVGARAHVQHLLAYAGVSVPHHELVDPRWDWVGPKMIANPMLRAETFQDLGRKWAPAPDYGDSLVKIAERLRGW